MAKTSIKGFSIKRKTETGLTAKLSVWVFSQGEIRIEQILLCEPDYKLAYGESCLRQTKKYKLIIRFLMLTNGSSIHVLKMVSELLNYFENNLKDGTK